MPLYVADYLADTGHLSTIEHGAYMLLIMHYWSKGGLPDDDKRLASIARASPEQWSVIRGAICEFFAPGWKHERIEEELEKSAKAYERRASAGRAGGMAKASNATAKPKQSLNTSLRSDERETRDQQFETVWAVYPRKTGKAPARKAFDAALKIADFPTILAGAERYAAERTGQDVQYTKHATTWFHGQHWADEPEPVRQSQPRSTSPPATASEPRNAGERARMKLNGTLPHEPPHSAPGRLDSGDRRGQVEGTGIARRITLATDEFRRN